MFVGYGKRPRHMRSKTWDASNGRASPTSPNGVNAKKQTAPYGPKKDREAFRRALVGIIRYGNNFSRYIAFLVKICFLPILLHAKANSRFHSDYSFGVGASLRPVARSTDDTNHWFRSIETYMFLNWHS